MVDFTSFIRFQPQLSPIMGSMSKSTQSLECRCIECQDNHRYEEMRRYTWDNHPGKLALSDERLSFCPPRVLGYAMRIKRWVQLLVSRTDEPGDASQEIFEKLQLKAETKDMIKSLVLAHDQGKTVGRGKAKGIVDFVEDKGKGLVVMLYGMFKVCYYDRLHLLIITWQVFQVWPRIARPILLITLMANAVG